MGWRGAIRSLAAASRAAERESLRRRKAAFREQQISDAAEAVAAWEDYITKLTRLTIVSSDPINWEAMANAPAPEPPVLENTQEVAARYAYDNFSPSFLDLLRGGSTRVLNRLSDAIPEAVIADAASFQARLAAHGEQMLEWKSDAELAKRIIRKDVEGYKEVIAESLSLADDENVGTNIQFLFTDEYVHALPHIHSNGIVPKFRRKQLESGRLSETKMPASQFHGIYREYVAGVSFKVAHDVPRILPLSEVYVTCKVTMLNSQTGHLERTPILSVQFVRSTLSMLKLNQLSPADALQNFNHVMKFKPAQGFSAIEPLKGSDG